MYRLEFTLDGLPKMTNRGVGKHFRVYMNHRDAWAHKVIFATVGKLPPKPLQKAKLTLVRCSSTEPDFDGLVSSFKAILDALKGRAIADDRPSCIGSPTFLWEKAKRGRGMVKVIVEEA
jgi:hypothetical protein